jgi:hypothetical protein
VPKSATETLSVRYQAHLAPRANSREQAYLVCEPAAPSRQTAAGGSRAWRDQLPASSAAGPQAAVIPIDRQPEQVKNILQTHARAVEGVVWSGKSC